MKRIQEKVKDIVEVRRYESLKDFTADPAATLKNYFFTDLTADLMSKWLQAVTRVSPEGGSAFALAGYRGVGKSHLLATLGAIISQPELRSRISDPLVSSSAQDLLRRHYPVVYVRRGTGETLLDELTAAIVSVLGISPADDKAESLLKAAVAKTGDLPLILMIDTAFERGERVARDDGHMLAEIAEFAKHNNVFVGVALDDDIAGADGANSGIARTFSIDYLDQEHLYKIVNSNVFPKNDALRPVISDVYEYFREVIPGFRWSEQRFSALYPLHPAILEVAPFVRLYVHDFALLGFAAEAGERILGRPANSLIALDEVFDSAEADLRKVRDLEEAFRAYDKLNSEVVGKIPVMQRLQAKLILKALLLLSLEGRGTTPEQIGAGMLIFDEDDPAKAIQSVQEIIHTFAEALPNDVVVQQDEGREPRFGFRVSSKDNLNKALAEAAQSQPASVVYDVARRLFKERFQDCTFTNEFDAVQRNWMEGHIEWRGGRRRGRILWLGDGLQFSEFASLPDSSVMDWEVVIDLTDDRIGTELPLNGDVSRVIWKPSAFRKDEAELLARLHVLSTNAELRAEFAEQVRPTLHSHTVSAEHIFNRVFSEDGVIEIDGFDYNLTGDARKESNLAGLFSIMLEPLFETRYPEHPVFPETLGVSEVAVAISDFFSGRRQDTPEAQRLARQFAMPLGLARETGDILVPAAGDEIGELPVSKAVLSLVTEVEAGTVPLDAVYANLKATPFGLVREAQHLVLAALAADRRLEFVTSKGDRINRRSLDLAIIWDDVVGVAAPLEMPFSASRLIYWASKFVGDNELTNLDAEKDRNLVMAAFSEWVQEWHKFAIIERFNDIPADALTLKIWKHAALTSKTLGGLVDNMEAAGRGTISIEECLHRIGEIFSDSEEHFLASQASLAVVESFVEGYPEREKVRTYIAQCGPFAPEPLSQLRLNLATLIRSGADSPSSTSNMELNYAWNKFFRQYAEIYADRHDQVMRSHGLQSQLNDIMRSDSWWEYQNIKDLPYYEGSIRAAADASIRRFNSLDCGFDVREALVETPSCMCGFSVQSADQVEKLPERLMRTLSAGSASFRQNLLSDSDELTAQLGLLSKESTSAIEANAAKELSQRFRDNDLSEFTEAQLFILRRLRRPRSAERDVDAVERPPISSRQDQTADVPALVEV